MAQSRSTVPGRARPRHWFQLVCLVVALLALDRLTKELVVRNLAVNESWAPIPSLAKVFTITHVQNTGIAFGQLYGLGWVFMVVNLVVLVGVVAYYTQIPEQMWSLRLASALILAGDLGNMIDRVRAAARFVATGSTIWIALSKASVTDMFDFKVWPVFNISDMCLVAGIITVGVVMWRIEARAQKAAETSTGDVPGPTVDEQGRS
jgi:signal peptidase II